MRWGNKQVVGLHTFAASLRKDILVYDQITSLFFDVAG